jgi:membrane protein implicated in regulation of membrane protease activity
VEVRHNDTTRAVNFAISSITLAAMSAMMFALLLITSRRAAGAEGAEKSYFWRLASVSAGLLALCGVMLAWVVVRYARYRLRRRHERSQTPYVDAWAEAGRRITLPDGEDEDADDETDQTP